jgi:aryl-alcohol dehydrogenase-like predicted oxidoreductase
MRTKTLGARSGIEVTAIGLGLWAVPDFEWGPGDERDVLEAIEAAREAGVNFFDTADVYGPDRSEELLGKAMAGRREEFVVATKIGWKLWDAEGQRSQYDTVDKLVAGVEESMQRLGTDYLDLIQCHISYPEPNTDNFIEGFKRLKEEGKVRAWGVSTGDLDHLKRSNADGDCDTLQIDYSILNRIPEREVFPYCQQTGIGVIVRGPLAMGLLCDKYAPTTSFPEGDFRQAWVEEPQQNAQFKQDLERVEQLREAVPPGETMSEFALRFVVSHPAVTSAIPGARNRRQAEANIAAASRPPLTPHERDRVDRVVPPGGGRKIWPEVT